MTTGKTKIKGVLIDARNNTVSDIEFEPTLEEMYQLIGCDTIEAVRWAVPDHVVYVDEEGLLKPATHWFSFGGAASFVGNGLIIGPPDAEGNETSASVTADSIRSLVRIFETKTNQEVPA